MQPASAVDQSKASSQSNKKSESPAKQETRLRTARPAAKSGNEEPKRNTRSSRSPLTGELPMSTRETRHSLRLQSKVTSQKKPNYEAESSEDESYHRNPLTRGRRRHEALTEIVDNGYQKGKMTDGLGGTHGFSDDEKELAIELEKEKAKKAEKKVEIYDDQKLKDMSILFGMDEDEVNDIREKQRLLKQEQQDKKLLFGEGTPSASPLTPVEKDAPV